MLSRHVKLMSIFLDDILLNCIVNLKYIFLTLVRLINLVSYKQIENDSKRLNMKNEILD